MTFGTIAILIGLAVGLIIGFSKTGMPSLGIFAVAVMAMSFPAKASVGLILPMLILGDIFAVSYYRHKVIWRYLWGIAPWVIVGLAGGYFVLEWSDNRGLQILIGSLVVVLVLLHIAMTRLNKQVEEWISNSFWFSAVIGILTGFTTMIGNAAGGIMTIYLLSKKLGKNEFIGTGAWFYLFVNLSKVPLYISLGLITWHSFTFDLWMIPAIVAGALVGVVVLKRIPEVWFQRIVLVLAGLGGLKLLWG